MKKTVVNTKNSVNLENQEFYTKEVIISLKKVRNIGLKYFSLSGQQISIKKNSQISFESSLERDFIQLLEFNKKVFSYYEQPIKILFNNEGKRKSYVPDFYIKYSDDRPDELVEIKFREDLKKNWSKYKPKFKAAKQFCDDNQIIFRIIDETKIRNTFLYNAIFLLSYIRPKANIDYYYVDCIFDFVRENEKSTPNEIIETLGQDISGKAELIFVIWYMVASDILHCDMNQKLTMNTKIYI